MTGFIKPEEIYAAQHFIVEEMKENNYEMESIPDAVQEFLKIHPVTKKKEAATFRKVNGVYVTERMFDKSETMVRPVEELESVI